MKTPLLLAAVVLALPSSLGAQTNDSHASAESRPAPLERIDDLVRGILARHVRVPGLTGAVVKDGVPYAVGVAGLRRYDRDVKATIDDQWHLGSCTKAMTATLAARLAAKKTFRWDVDVQTAFAKAKIEVHEGYRSVPISALLVNRGGVPSDLNFDGLWGKLWEKKGTPTEQRKELARAVLGRPPAVAPEKRFLYSNAGFALAGLAMEIETGKAWEDLMREEIFAPLGIASAGFGSPGKAEAVDQPAGHKFEAGERKVFPPGPDSDNPPAIGPGGTVHMSMTDWARFAAAHAIGEKGESAFLDADLFKALHTPPAEADYAMGWVVTTRPWGGRVITHNGSNTMWFSAVWIAPDKRFAVLAAANIGGDEGSKAVDALCAAMIGKFGPR